MTQYLVIVGALINILGSISYVKATLLGQTKPNRVTWLLWSVIPTIAVSAEISRGVTWAVLPVFMSGFCPFIIFLSSFTNKNSYWKLNKLDYLCGGLSALGIILWLITNQPITAFILALTADILASIPTLLKAWMHPETESGFTYLAGFINGLFAFTAVQTWKFIEIAWPIYLTIICALIAYPIFFKRSQAKVITI